MPPSRDPFVLFPVNERQCETGHRAKRYLPIRVIALSKGGHCASVNERHSMTLVTHSSLLKSINPEEGGSSCQATRGSPHQLAHWVGWLPSHCTLSMIRPVFIAVGPCRMASSK